MLNNIELDHLDDLLIESVELEEFKAAHEFLPYSVARALDKHEKDLRVEINRMIKYLDGNLTFLEAKQYLRKM